MSTYTDPFGLAPGPDWFTVFIAAGQLFTSVGNDLREMFGRGQPLEVRDLPRGVPTDEGAPDPRRPITGSETDKLKEGLKGSTRRVDPPKGNGTITRAQSRQGASQITRGAGFFLGRVVAGFTLCGSCFEFEVRRMQRRQQSNPD